MTRTDRPEEDEPDDLARDPELARALDALEPRRADPAFEARLRSRFLSGEGGAADTPSAARRRPRPLGRLVLWASLAAAALAVYLYVERRDGAAQPAWEVIEGTRGHVVLVDGVEYSPGWETELGRALAAGGHVRTPEGSALRLRFGGYLELDVGPESSVRLPPVDLEEESARFYLVAELGSLALATGPDFPGSTLRVIAPDAEVEVLGTRFAVDVSDAGTCVCCTEGEVSVRPLASVDPEAEVAAGGLGFVFPDGELVTLPEIKDEHVDVLPELGGAW